MTGPMDTLADRMRQLHAAGWTEQLSVDDGGLRCDSDGGLRGAAGLGWRPKERGLAALIALSNRVATLR